MYESLANFLKIFSSNIPILWALFVMLLVGGTGLTLYAFWELVLGWIFSERSRSRRREGQ